DASERDDGVGVTIESEDHRHGLMLASISDGLFDDLLVAEVDAVEKADRQTNAPIGGLQFGSGMGDFHAPRVRETLAGNPKFQNPNSKKTPKLKVQKRRGE